MDNEAGDFTSTQVSILRTTCKDSSDALHAGRFVVFMLAAFALRYARSLLSWEVSQESRVLLKKTVAEREEYETWYYWLYGLNNLAYIFQIIVIMGRNLWVYLALLVAQQAATVRFFRRSKSDGERGVIGDGKDHNDEVDMRLHRDKAGQYLSSYRF